MALLLGRRSLIAAAPAALAGCTLAGCTLATSSYPYPPLRPVAAVDLARYYGQYYITAHIPYFAEAGYVGAYVDYSSHQGGGINDVYYAHSKTFDGKLIRFPAVDYVVPGTGNARWRVTKFDALIGLPYVIIYLAPDYSVSLVGFPNRSLGWIFSRSKTMSDAEYRFYLSQFAAQGYDPGKFRRVPQTTEEIGQPGYDPVA